MSVKLTRKEQLQIIEELRYGGEWAETKKNILKYEYELQGLSIEQNQFNNTIVKYQIQPHRNQPLQASEFNLLNKLKQQQRILKDQQNIQVTQIRPPNIQNQSNFIFKEQFQKHSQCRKCSKTGHSSQYCMFQIRCLYCLSSQHTQQDCLYNFICFKCYKLGHPIQNCPQSSTDIYCTVCQRDHVKDLSNLNCYSLARGRQQKKALYPTDKILNDMQILCMKCKKLGHLNCQ